jgi:hypothetical protein
MIRVKIGVMQSSHTGNVLNSSPNTIDKLSSAYPWSFGGTNDFICCAMII